MSKQNINIWGRDFQLDVVFDCYADEDILDSQKVAFEKLISAHEVIENAKVDLERYCLARNGDEIGTATIENIFKFVIPKSFYIQRTTDTSRIVGLMCAYKFDIENGIAVIFKNEKMDKIGTQNIIL